MNYYTGVGSRETPGYIRALMTSIARDFAARGWVLRSGGADGADLAFEAGAGDRKEIYLPWPGFNGRGPSVCDVSPYHGDMTPQAREIAAAVHPAWHMLSDAARLLHARNAHQVLGVELDTPSKAVVCWTPHARVTGGTATAIRIAEQHGIPVFNLAARDGYDRYAQWTESL